MVLSVGCVLYGFGGEETENGKLFVVGLLVFFILGLYIKKSVMVSVVGVVGLLDLLYCESGRWCQDLLSCLEQS